VSERPDLPWTFRVVDDPIVNAFALPGGFIYVTRGILAHFDSEAELAGVLGHEIGHVTARHSVSQISRQQVQQIGLGVGMILSEDVRRVGGLLSAGMQLMNLSYSRGDETQSDELGLRYISRLGYDPFAMVGVFEMLANVGGGGEGRIPEWQLTHPYPENRASNIRARIAEAGLPSGGTVAREAYLDHLDGMVFDEDPRQGYFKGARFVHPELAFELTFPAGWNTVNQRSVVAAIEPGQQALLTLEVDSNATDPVTALRAFLAQDGITGGTVREETTNGVRRARAEFEAATEQGTVRGEVAYMAYRDVVYRMLGYAANASTWTSHAAGVRTAVSSFAPLTDPAILAVRPWTIDIRTLSGATSLATYHGSNPSPVDLADLARLNRVTPQEVLPGGTLIKWVVGAPLP
jgi:predicted Zn-dependent protease